HLRVPRPALPLTLSLSRSGGEGIETAPSPLRNRLRRRSRRSNIVDIAQGFLRDGLRGERLHEVGELPMRRQLAHEPDHAQGLLVGDGEDGVAAELRLQLFETHGELGPAARVVLPLLDDSAVVEADGDMADELPRIVDGRIVL